VTAIGVVLMRPPAVPAKTPPPSSIPPAIKHSHLGRGDRRSDGYIITPIDACGPANCARRYFTRSTIS
jgi:hypothetical protein